MKTHFTLLALFVFALLYCYKKTPEKSIIPSSLHTQISILAGSGTAGDADGPATTATFKNLWAIAVDGAGNVYVTDNGNVQIRKITPDGNVTTLADNPNASGSIVYGNAQGLVIDAAGNFYVSYGSNNCIRKITPDGKTGVVFAGNPTVNGGFDDGTGTSALFQSPTGLAIDAAGNIYVGDYGNNAIRKITPAGVVTTVSGTGAAGSVDGAIAQASFYGPLGLALDKSGNIFVADAINYKIRKIGINGTVSTVAGSGSQGFAEGTGTSATFQLPTGLIVTSDGTIYLTDLGNSMLRKITPTGVVSYVGDDVQYYGYYGPADVAIDKSGTLYVTNSESNRVLKIIPAQL